MVKEIYPSSYECACGYQLDFCERTIRDIKRMSERKQQRLMADDEKHVVVFAQGRAVDIQCPTSRKNRS